MKLFHLTAATALLLGAVTSQATVLPSLDLSSGSAYFGNTPTIGGFTDTVAFTLTGAYLATASLTAVVNGNRDVDFTSIDLVGPGGAFAFSQINPDPVEVWALPLAGVTLAAGTYTITLTGTTAAGGGSYAGNLAITSVPEPVTVALMLAGLGALGVTVRRIRG